ncbi:MAG TPA: glycoside hydrolase family 9 protein [Burkholderiaceae bacterium]
MNCLRRGWIVAAVTATVAGVAPACFADVQLRVDQVGYEPGRDLTAYLMTSAGDAVRAVDVVDAGGRVAGGATLAAGAMPWGAYAVQALTFKLAGSGRYHLVAHLAAAGAADVASVEFPVEAGAVGFAAPLRHALQFYQAERDGPDYVPGGLRDAPAHLNDAAATAYVQPTFSHDTIVGPLVPTGKVLDASGGWWDAGDYIKFVQTHSYTVGMLLTGVRDFPAQMGAQGATDFTAEARFGLEWLLKMWDDDSRTLYYQVALGTGISGDHKVSDHDLWRLPELDDTYGGTDPRDEYIRHRPVLQAGPAGSPVSPNLAGRMAASFALAYRVFKNVDRAFADRCLLAAEHVYELAERHPKPPLLTAAPFDFYPEKQWHDDMEWGATELALALRYAAQPLPAGLPHDAATHYLREATMWANEVINQDQPGADPLSLYDVSPLAHYDLHRAITVMPYADGLHVTAQQLQDALVGSVQAVDAVAARDPFGFGTEWNNWDTTTRGLGIAVMASQAAHLSGDPHWKERSREWLGNVLGANAWGLSLIVGDGVSWPECLQHQGANLLGSFTDDGNVLYGAAVEGTNATRSVVGGTPSGARKCPADGVDRFAAFDGNGAEFDDRVSNYPNTEPAIDLTAASPLIFAWRIAGEPIPDALK